MISCPVYDNEVEPRFEPLSPGLAVDCVATRHPYIQISHLLPMISFKA